jgi:hypothetical protein
MLRILSLSLFLLYPALSEAFVGQPSGWYLSLHSVIRPPRTTAFVRRRRDEEYEDWDNDDIYNEDDDRRRDLRRRRRVPRDDLGNFDDGSGLDLPSSYGRRDGWRLPESVSKALLAGVFVLGVGLGVTIDSQVNTNPKDLASRDAIDNAAPNPTLCAKLGASAMAFDQRVFVSFNPFNVYVSQADVKPACVLREANVVPILKARGLINDNEVRSCKQNMNTWAFVGSLDDTPQLSCVYRSQDAQNEFLSNPKVGLGEDYLDDDRDNLEKLKSTGKLVKGGMTEAQKALLKKQTTILPGLE